MDIAAHLDLALELADLADAITMARFRAADLQVTTKPDLTPVSEADHAVERDPRAAARDRSRRLAKSSAATGAPTQSSAGSSIPIDGTKSYVRGLPIWCTLIGLEHAGELVLGVASAPGLHALVGRPRPRAFRDGERIQPSAVAALDDAQFPSLGHQERFDADGIGDKLLALAHRCWRFRGVGDFWQHVLVAEGAVDIAIDPIVSLWDIAALVPIIEESGARWTTLDGRSDVNGNSFVCTNGPLHDAVIAALA